MTQRWIYAFGPDGTDGDADMREILGGKGAGLAEMSRLGLPVPPGFTITTDACVSFLANGGAMPDGLEAATDAAIVRLGDQVGARFSDTERPLLVSVRSGARASMPGMMDTILNLGLNDASVEALARGSGDARFAWDCYRRFIQMFGNVALKAPHARFEEALEAVKDSRGATLDTDLDAEALREVARSYLAIVRETTGKDFPQDPREQLIAAVRAVFASWNNARARTYRRLHDVPDSWGTAVNIQAMVFGNMGEGSATGVAFTRDPSTGENMFYGEYLPNAQGEDVVAGIRTPLPLSKAASKAARREGDAASLEETMPEMYTQLLDMRAQLEARYCDMQDIEFTIERSRLWLLQTRAGKRTAQAAIRVAVEMARDGLISQSEALMRVEPNSLEQILHPTIDPKAKRDILTTGLPASPGAASGEAVFSAHEAEDLKRQNRPCILVRPETSPEDIHGMHAAEGFLTARGGMTSHAAVIARGMGKPCVAGAQALRIDEKRGEFHVGDRVIRRGDLITIDGATGQALLGDAPRIMPEISGDFAQLMEWADAHRRMRVRANADTPQDARTALRFGAEGIGLCRTEHMFFDAERIATVRAMILANDDDERRAALDKLLPLQRHDFREIFGIMKGLPVTIRLLDPPLHEFLPRADEIPALAAQLGTDPESIARRAAMLHESNPMLGHRGCRLAITFPEIYETQARAIFEAGLAAREADEAAAAIEIMIPLVSMRAEVDFIAERLRRVADEVFAKVKPLVWSLGVMVELPRAALLAGDIAQSAAFFSFGTNDLTQTTYGLSRDDAAAFLGSYTAHGLLKDDPFVTLDSEGVAELIRTGVARGRATRANLKAGLCGEHGGDPASIRICEDAGLDYVSCSPYRAPIARLAAAQATLAAADASSDHGVGVGKTLSTA